MRARGGDAPVQEPAGAGKADRPLQRAVPAERVVRRREGAAAAGEPPAAEGERGGGGSFRRSRLARVSCKLLILKK